MGFGDFAHDVGEAGVALWSSDKEGVDQSGESDRTHGYWTLLRRWIARVEPVELEEKALGGSAEVVAHYVEAHMLIWIEYALEVVEGSAHPGFGIADTEYRVVEDRS